MSTIKNVAVFFVIVLILLVSAGVWYAWQTDSCPLVGRSPFENVKYTFSEFEEINGTGVYVSEVLEMDRGEMYQCSSDNKVLLVWLDVHLIDNEGSRNFTGNLWYLQDNYAGNISETVDLSAEIANDNGTEFPIHFENQMNNDFEKYGKGNLGGDQLYLSIGDKIKVYGSGSEADGPAENGWSVQIGSGHYDMPNTDLVIP